MASQETIEYRRDPIEHAVALETAEPPEQGRIAIYMELEEHGRQYGYLRDDGLVFDIKGKYMKRPPWAAPVITSENTSHLAAKRRQKYIDAVADGLMEGSINGRNTPEAVFGDAVANVAQIAQRPPDGPKEEQTSINALYGLRALVLPKETRTGPDIGDNGIQLIVTATGDKADRVRAVLGNVIRKIGSGGA